MQGEQAVAPAPARTGEYSAAAHGLRGLASLMVLFAHIFGGVAEHVYAAQAGYVAAVRGPWNLGTFGVQLFFVISGYVILPSALRYDARDFALRRALRIYPLFFVLSVLFVLLNAWTNAYPKVDSPLAIVSGFLFLNLFTGTEQLTPNAWSLTYEVVFYVLTCAVVTLAVKRRAPLRAAFPIGASIAFLAAFPIAIYFVAGLAIRLLRWRSPGGGPHSRIVEAAACVAMVALATRGHYEYWWRDFADPTVVPLIVATGIFFYCAVAPGSLTETMLGNRIAAYVGTISYSLYLVHPYTYFAARKLFVDRGLFTDDIAASMASFAAVVTVASFVVAHVVHVGLERGPYEWVFRQRIYRTAGTGAQAGEAAAMQGRTA